MAETIFASRINLCLNIIHACIQAETTVPRAFAYMAELVKISLVFAWAYAESVYDVRSLLQGGRIPLLKSEGTWHYSLSGMLDFASDTRIEGEGTVCFLICVWRENALMINCLICSKKDILCHLLSAFLFF